MADTEQIIFGSLLETLRRQGLSLGVEHYIRLQKLINSLPADCSIRQLKTLLCPIFASNEKEQDLFFRLFDAYFDLTPPDIETQVTPNPTDRNFKKNNATTASRRWKLQHTIISLTVVVFVGGVGLGLWWMFYRTNVNQSKLVYVEREIPTRELPNKSDKELKVIQAKISQPQENLSSQFATEYQPDRKKKDRWPDILQIAAVLIPLFIFAAYELYRRRRRKLILDNQRGKKPPHSFLIRVPSILPKFYEASDFYTAVRLLRKRQISEPIYLDPVSTVKATIKSRGFPSLRYKFSSKPLEYLILIDRVSYGDHQARLFSFLANSLEREDVILNTYFFYRDPKVCYHVNTEQTVYLHELQQKYQDSRLILFSNGDGLLDPLTGTLEDWGVQLFAGWDYRAILTPHSPVHWGWAETNLEDLFFVLPATLQGLLDLTYYFELNISQDLYKWSDRVGGDLTPSISQHPTIEELECYLGTDAFQWLCACAVYPELNWNLTIYLGSLPCMPENLMNEENILRLSSLIWFRKNSIPDDWRWQLIKRLERENEKAIRSALIDLLDHCPPPSDTYAFDIHQLNLSLQQWQLNKTRKSYKRLKKLITSIPPSVVTRDFVLLRYLESRPNSILENVIPKRFHKYFFRHGLSVYGLKTITVLLIATLISVISLIGLEAIIRFYDLRQSPTVPSSLPPTDDSSSILAAKKEAGASDKSISIANSPAEGTFSGSSQSDTEPILAPVVLPNVMTVPEFSRLQAERPGPYVYDQNNKALQLINSGANNNLSSLPPPPEPRYGGIPEVFSESRGDNGKASPFGSAGAPRCARLSTASQSEGLTTSVLIVGIPVSVIYSGPKFLGKKIVSGLGSVFSKKKPTFQYINSPPNVILDLGRIQLGSDDTLRNTSRTICSGDKVELFAKASDPDGDALLYSWSSTGGRIVGDGAKTFFDTTGLAPGDYTIIVQVDDGCGRIAFEAKTVRVGLCPPLTICFNPNLEIEFQGVSFVPPNELVTVSTMGVTKGRNYGSVIYTWSVSGGKLLRNGSLDAQIDTAGIAPGTIIDVTVTAKAIESYCIAEGKAELRIIKPE